MANLFFISDTHFGHANILTFLGPDGLPLRPFASVEEMDEVMVTRWNETVRPSDHIYHLGDVSMIRPKRILPLLQRLQGHKRLVRGNHDVYKTREYLDAGFEEIYGSRVLENFLFTHIPVHPLSLGRFRANVHGHIHANAVFPPPYLNVSVEVTHYRPLAIEEIRQRVAQWGERPRHFPLDTPTISR